MNDNDQNAPTKQPRLPPWNKDKLVGPKPPLKVSHIWSIRTKMKTDGRTRDLALFNLAIDSKLRGCDLVALRVDDVAPHGRTADRATVRQSKTVSNRSLRIDGADAGSGRRLFAPGDRAHWTDLCCVPLDRRIGVLQVDFGVHESNCCNHLGQVGHDAGGSDRFPQLKGKGAQLVKGWGWANQLHSVLGEELKISAERHLIVPNGSWRQSCRRTTCPENVAFLDRDRPGGAPRIRPI